MEITQRKTADLIPYVNNARTHSEQQVLQIASSIKEFGFNSPVLVDGDNGIIAGHGRVMAAKKLGLDELPTIELKHLTKTQKKAYILADNRLALNSGWDNDLLALELGELSDDGFDLNLLGFDDTELSLGDEPETTEGLTDEDAVPDIPDEPITKLGDVWLCGNHRVMCGDSTSIDAVDKLMNGNKADMVFTDPPYGVSAGGGRTQTVKSKGIRKIENDDLRGDNLERFIFDAISIIPKVENCSLYICYDQKTQFEFLSAIKKTGLNIIKTIIWNKNVFGLSGGKGYRPKYEIISFCSNQQDYLWHGDNSQADVWDIPRPNERHGNHPTPKPIILIEKALSNSSKDKDLIIDLFGGSGSTLLACEKTNRINYSMELDPKYCDVIIKRWQDFTGKQAILESTGEPYGSHT